METLSQSGGLAPMVDTPEHPLLKKVIKETYERKAVVGAVCHGPVSLLNVKLSEGNYLVAGKRIRSFTNAEEENYAKADVPFELESALVGQGAIFQKAAPWHAFSIAEGKLVTGQNPASAKGVGEKMVKLLGSACGAATHKPTGAVFSSQRSRAIRIRDILLAILLFSPFILLVGGGNAICFLYAPGERLDARGDWILEIMVVPYFLRMSVALIWGKPQELDYDDDDEDFPASEIPLMQDDVVALFTYDRWANAKVLDACRKLTAEQYVAEPIPGWSSVRSTVYHIALATEFNLRALAGASDDGVPPEADLATVDDVAELLERAYRRFEELRPTLTPERLTTMLTLRAIGRTFTLPRWAILRHIVNHSSYHRGQLASKLKRFGIEQPITDFFWWVIEQVPQET